MSPVSSLKSNLALVYLPTFGQGASTQKRRNILSVCLAAPPSAKSIWGHFAQKGLIMVDVRLLPVNIRVVATDRDTAFIIILTLIEQLDLDYEEVIPMLKPYYHREFWPFFRSVEAPLNN